jgi:uncharacterized membrane protein YfcA
MEMAIYLLLGALAGLIGGALGIGGGAVMVPVMILWLHMKPHTAIGTSLAVIIPIAMVATARHYQLGNVNTNIAIPLMIGGFVGALFGPWLISQVPELWAKRALAIFWVYAAIRLWLTK